MRMLNETLCILIRSELCSNWEKLKKKSSGSNNNNSKKKSVLQGN